VIGIIPAAGDAKRMNGVLKFFLPIPGKNKTLIDWHIENQLKVCEKIIIATKPENAIMFKYLLKDPRICIFLVETKTASETIKKVVDFFP
jgi:GTP:adenosylcobinamide-phosphate guanylyltransferase